MLKEDERNSGLSVSFDCTTAECRAGFNRTYGVASLLAQSIFDLALQVVPDTPTHANITGIPYKEDDPDRAEWLAGKLAECATVVEHDKQQRREG